MLFAVASAMGAGSLVHEYTVSRVSENEIVITGRPIFGAVLFDPNGIRRDGSSPSLIAFGVGFDHQTSQRTVFLMTGNQALSENWFREKPAWSTSLESLGIDLQTEIISDLSVIEVKGNKTPVVAVTVNSREHGGTIGKDGSYSSLTTRKVYLESDLGNKVDVCAAALRPNQ